MRDLFLRWLARVLAVFRGPAEIEQLRADLAALQRDNLLMRSEVAELQRRQMLLEEFANAANDTQKRMAIAIGPSVLDAVELPREPRLRLVTSNESFARKEV